MVYTVWDFLRIGKHMKQMKQKAVGNPINELTMTEITGDEFPYVEFTCFVKLPKDAKWFDTQHCKRSVNVGNYKNNTIYTNGSLAIQDFYMRNNDKLFLLHVEKMTPAPPRYHTHRRKKLTEIFELFYKNPHKDWGLLFEIYKLRDLL